MPRLYDLRDVRPVVPPPTVEQLRAEHAAWVATMAGLDRFIAWLHERMPEAEAAERAYDDEVARLQAAQRQIENGPQTGLWLEPSGQPRPGIDADAVARHRQISVRLAELERTRQAWLDETMRWDDSRQGYPQRWSPRHVPSLTMQIVDSNLTRALVGSSLNDAALRLAAAEGR